MDFDRTASVESKIVKFDTLCKKFGKGLSVIRSLEIENFRCFRSISLSDLRRFTIIVGENGSGKTAFLESLFVAAGGSAEIYLRADAWRGQERFKFPSDSVIPLFEDFFYRFDPSNGLRISFTDSQNRRREVRAIADTPEKISLPFDEQFSQAIHSRDIRFIWKTPKGETESELKITKDGLEVTKPADVFPMVFVNSLTLGATKDHADRWSELSARNLERPIEEAVKKLFREVQGLSVLSPRGIPVIHFKVKGLEQKIPAGLFSAGANKLVVILTSVGFARRGVVLIDEIENGLYYKKNRELWQVVSDFAVENNVQIFATTHSNEFLEAIAPIAEKDNDNYSLLRIERQNGEVNIASFNGREFAGSVRSGFEVR